MMDDLVEQILAANGTAETVDGLARVLRMTAVTFLSNPNYDDAVALSRLAADLAAAAERNRDNLIELVSTAGSLYEELPEADEVSEVTEEVGEGETTASIH